VIQYVVKGADEKILADAVAMGMTQRAGTVVVVGGSSTEEDEVVVVDLTTKPIKKTGRPRAKTMKMTDLVTLARRNRRGGKELS
jgi:hypothetical protein